MLKITWGTGGPTSLSSFDRGDDERKVYTEYGEYEPQEENEERETFDALTEGCYGSYENFKASGMDMSDLF